MTNWKKLKHERRGGFRSAVDYPAVKIATGRSNTTINAAAMKNVNIEDKKTKETRPVKKGDRVKFAVYQHPKNPLKFAISFWDEDSDWNTKVTKSGQLSFWFGPFLQDKGVELKGAHDTKPNGKRGPGERFLLKLEEEDGMFVFEIPEDKLATEKDKKATKKKSKKKKSKKKKKILKK